MQATECLTLGNSLLNINCRVTCGFNEYLLDKFQDLRVISPCIVLPLVLAIAVESRSDM